jgi:Rrf2 family protein
MKLTRSAGYAVGILLRVQSAGMDGPMTADSISRGCKFPPRFLYRVLRKLVDAGLLAGISGPHGGYRLAKRPPQIRLLDIVLAVEEPNNSGALIPVQKGQTPAIAFVNGICDRNAEMFHSELAKVNLAKLSQLCAKTAKKPTPSRGKSTRSARR